MSKEEERLKTSAKKGAAKKVATKSVAKYVASKTVKSTKQHTHQPFNLAQKLLQAPLNAKFVATWMAASPSFDDIKSKVVIAVAKVGGRSVAAINQAIAAKTDTLVSLGITQAGMVPLSTELTNISAGIYGGLVVTVPDCAGALTVTNLIKVTLARALKDKTPVGKIP